MIILTPTVLVEGLQFPEGPRWHDGRLWFSDMNAQKVMTVDLSGNLQTIVQVSGSPSGLGWLPDGKTLIVAETFGQRLTAFDILPDGMLAKRRVWADMKGYFPDGICLDEAGGIWVASPENHAGVLRVFEGGRISHRVSVESNAYACMLGNHDRRTLFVLTAGASNPRQAAAGGRIEIVEVESPGTGLP